MKNVNPILCKMMSLGIACLFIVGPGLTVIAAEYAPAASGFLARQSMGGDEEARQSVSLPRETEEQLITKHAKTVVDALAEKDFATVADYVHPKKGVRFSPYAYVKKAHRSFTPECVSKMMNDSTVYFWGTYDGSGHAIELTPAEYYERFLYQKDFARAEDIHFDQLTERGNTLHNADEVYPDAHFVEFHLPGSEELAGMDWASLIMAFEKWNGQWYLVGMIQDQWTI
ncbi:hypothetical protein M3202_19925 [Alkalihalobacillus oceani]|uniref:Uncharacterized protein n=1 Tax=Halalkalibacter oceani TaxID=1653776 RepID=A0A9X2IRD0_9BACI|nr:hypothetical protein [Halalkalibacter oceani]MCM3716317.1 hypothetical protein [Halalkalibacter oceani]